MRHVCRAVDGSVIIAESRQHGMQAPLARQGPQGHLICIYLIARATSAHMTLRYIQAAGITQEITRQATSKKLPGWLGMNQTDGGKTDSAAQMTCCTLVN
jgi:hypothetical protein